MTWLVVIAILFLVFGPLRRHAFGRQGITFTLPALAGGALGLWFGLRAEAQGAQIPGLTLLCVALGAFWIGGAVKAGLNEMLRGGKDHDSQK